MRPSWFVVSFLSVTLVNALPTPSDHVVHEKRGVSSHWAHEEFARPNPQMILPIRIGLAQSNMDMLHDMLMDVSDPDSGAFSKHLSADEVHLPSTIRERPLSGTSH